MKKKILVVGGGYSKERNISLKTAKAVIASIKKTYNVKFCEPDKNLKKMVKKFKPNVVFNALHGRFGEDGFIQSVFETLNVKYTHSGVLSSMLAMDKELSKKLFIKNKILTPKFIKLTNENIELNIKKIEQKLIFPVVIKPLNEGSSFDVYISEKKNLKKNLKKMKNYNEILIEQFIPGREIQASIMGGKKLGAIELKPKRKFYDFEAKYNSDAKTKHIIPINISSKKYEELMHIALKAHKILNCKGITRSDFKFFKNKFYLLEVNTQPGMTNLSLVPEIAEYKGMNFKSLVSWIIKDASKTR
tara:strand:+ start:1821 stop:2729 length:909 start_codon:yes stop_codon:yes gene_type:complete